MIYSSYGTVEQPAHLLLVEDNPGDVILTRMALEETGLVHELKVVTSGEACLTWLKKQQSQGALNMPNMILLDVNLPEMSGIEVLRFIKQDACFRIIPVLMLSSSSAQRDVVASYGAYASGYLVKPSDVQDYHQVIHTIQNFWFGAACLPDAKTLDACAPSSTKQAATKG